MRLRIPRDNEEWNSFVAAHKFGSLLASTQWGEFQRKLDREVFYLMFEEDGEVKGAALAIRQQLFGPYTFLYVPYPPIISDNAVTQSKLVEALRVWAMEQSDVFMRVELNVPKPNDALQSLFTHSGFRLSKKEAQPHHVWVSDLTISDNDLLRQMKPKTRYNIRVASKHDLRIAEGSTLSDIEVFVNLIQETSQRNDFTPHTRKYYLKEFNSLYPDHLKLLLAYKDDEAVAGVLLGFFGSRVTYLHGASKYKYRHVMAPYLLHWAALHWAKEEGFREYDWGGIHPDPEHPWAGITRFKKGFPGQEISYLPTLELPIKPLIYKAYKFVSKLR